ncbi:MAG TPA: septum formation family protein [Candidatus Corynebacterium avicola]|uniref:Septum formation family protein n=1 Tax=Candidatus Corynebacterium avicola TaxID=2838527 RepID=A0A9D1UL62_9CORY|nr:septum formation family protein [Candidatus Corynebacterium avicola]
MHRVRRSSSRHHRASYALPALPVLTVACASALALGGCTIGDVTGGDDGDGGGSSPANQDAPSDGPVPSDEADASRAADMQAEPEPGAEDEESGEPADTDPTSPGARGVGVGDCVADLDQLSGTEEIEVVDCAEPHVGEVYSQSDITGKTLFPGNQPLGEEAGEICGGEDFTSYVGIAFGESSLDVVTMMPSKDSWAQGDRTVTCVVTDPAVEETEGTLGQSFR